MIYIWEDISGEGHWNCTRMVWSYDGWWMKLGVGVVIRSRVCGESGWTGMDI